MMEIVIMGGGLYWMLMIFPLILVRLCRFLLLLLLVVVVPLPLLLPLLRDGALDLFACQNHQDDALQSLQLLQEQQGQLRLHNRQ